MIHDSWEQNGGTFREKFLLLGGRAFRKRGRVSLHAQQRTPEGHLPSALGRRAIQSPKARIEPTISQSMLTHQSANIRT
jgi:hypothetical protein